MWQEFYYKKICIIQTYYYFSFIFFLFLFRFLCFEILHAFTTAFLSCAFVKWVKCLHLNILLMWANVFVSVCVCVYICDGDMLTALFLFVCCFPFPFHLMLSSPDFTLGSCFSLCICFRNSSSFLLASFFSLSVSFLCFLLCLAQKHSVLTLSLCECWYMPVRAFFYCY